MRTAARGVFVLLLAFVTVVTIVPDPEDAGVSFTLVNQVSAVLFGSPDYGDKIAHFLAYGALGFVLALSRFGAPAWALGGVAPLVLYGAALEQAQVFSGTRTPDVADALANGAGTLAGYLGGRLALGLLAVVSRPAGTSPR